MKKSYLQALPFALLPFFALLFLYCSSGDSSPNNGDSDTDVKSENEEEFEANEPFLFAVISDTHIMLADDSKNNLTFAKTGKLFNEWSQAIDFVVNTGDLVHDLFCIPEINCNELVILDIYKKLIDDNFKMPFYNVIGNHDNRYFDSFVNTEVPNKYWLDTFKGSESFPAPYYVVDHKGFQFIMMDGTDEAFDHDSNDTCTFSKEQLDWLKGLLDNGKPSVLFWHQYVFPEDESDVDSHPILPIVKQYQDVIKGIFMGHGHRFVKVTWEGVPFYETGAISGKDEPVYHMIKCDPSKATILVINEKEITYSELKN